MKDKKIFKKITAILVGTTIVSLSIFSFFPDIAVADHGATHPPEEHPPVECSTTSIKAGYNDDWSTSNVEGSPSPSSNFLSWLGSRLLRDFDDMSSNKVFGHTFAGLPQGIVAATLELRLQARPDLPYNDGVSLELTGTPSFTWGSRISSLPEAGGTWNVGQDTWFTLNLAALPNADGSFTNILPSINFDQALDVYIQDDTAIDVLFLTITYCPIDVDIDIKPGSFPNSINLKNNGTIPVAILGSSIDVTTIDQSSVTFGPNDAKPVAEKKSLEDVDGDGKLDLVLHFRTQDTGISADDIEAILTGETTDGVKFTGTDSVRPLSPQGKGKKN